jgi:hypothetical protein
MFFIYVSELQEKTSMDKEHRKRENKSYTRSPTSIYTTSYREVKGREFFRERDHIRSMKTRGDISTREVTLFTHVFKGEER